MIKLATGNTIAGLVAGFRMLICPRFFISNLREIPSENFGSSDFQPNFAFARGWQKVEGGQPRVMTSVMLSLNARTCLSVRTAARSGPSPKARARTLKLVPSINAIGLILRFKAWMVWRVFIFGAAQSLIICVIMSEAFTASIVPARKSP